MISERAFAKSFPSFWQELAPLLTPRFVGGNHVELLQCGAEFFPALEQAIDAATREVRLETYIFADDVTGRRIADALGRAAHRGVAVRVVYDGFGSASWLGSIDQRLRNAGVEVAVFRPDTGWHRFERSRLRRLHRKLAMIDGRVAFVGGINIIDDLNMPEPRHPRFDYAVCVRGPLLARIHTAMAELWARLHQHGLERLRAMMAAFPPVSEPAGDYHAWFAFRDNVSHRRDIELEYLAAILSARSDILIANAYFFPGQRFRRALLRARRRGVRVRARRTARRSLRIARGRRWEARALARRRGTAPSRSPARHARGPACIRCVAR